MLGTLISTGIPWLWLTLVVLAMDIGSKQWVMTHLKLGESVSVMPFINIFYTQNPGAAFSFLADKGSWNIWVFALIAVIISVILSVTMYRSNNRASITNVSYAMIIGGALGNLLDRITHGVVIDFIDVYVDTLHWPTFNIADSSICIGAAIIVREIYFHPTKKRGDD
ncbi:signal peptidase II [Candidatus Palibaumannia cicadellinicola]|uniref:Lipoprotein signal peptidase n=1 Tax=Candidatus Palibaumannia cicadellinicola TaxID=186490 RepID=A0A2N4XWD6_9GAMM|nr:signal peptidase II [Candidatus Baumannia cicadellinicola]PLK58303.1 signal peptidase II [Candidatus Baumannia cicadellinicola]